ncbi:MAG: hypothetical protein AMJ69_11200 [Gammaproteobacteria bacterium SG8_47]|nr:MAG: hypothetical protein AMJ69_11200 [Gammaproteobacteria bacterium SG8_47]
MNILPFVSLAVAALLSGCAAVAEAPPAPAPGSDQAPQAQVPLDLPPVESGLTGELLYHVMAAEVAGQRGRLDLAVENYLQAARLSGDPKVAERATRIAVYARNDQAALDAARVWVDAEPDSVDANQVVAALLVRRGELDEATERLEHVLQLGGNGDTNRYMLITTLLSREQDKAAALEVMNRLLARRPDNPDALYAFAHLAYLVGDYDRSLEAVDQALALKPDWSVAHILRANTLIRQGQTELALTELGKVVERYPEDSELRMFYARKLMEARRLDAARDQFKALLKYQPDNTAATFALGLLSLQLNEFNEAEGYFKTLVKRGDRAAEASYFLGQLYEARRKNDEAMNWYGQVRDGDYLFDAQMRIAALLAKRGDIAEARERLNSIPATTNQARVRIYLTEGEILREAKQYQEAFDLYTSALEVMPQNVDLLYARGLTAERIDRLDVLEADFKAVLAIDPDNAQALNALGYTLADRTTRYEEALQYIQRAMELRPNDAAVIDSMGWTLYRLGRHDEALKYLRRAFEMLNDPEIAAHLGEVLWVTGDHDRARAVWDDALREAPQHEILLDVIKRFTQ